MDWNPQFYASKLFARVKIQPFLALKETFREGYGFKDLRSDIMAGIIVAMVAIPLGMALAIASGVAPQYGLYTVVIAGFIVALFGGSRFQVTGPTAAFVVILAPIVHNYGIGGLMMAGLMAGIFLIFLGATGMGRMIYFIPHPVTTGFTSGIAVVIATIQLTDFFGLHLDKSPDNYIERILALAHALPTWSPVETIVSAATLFSLFAWPKISKKIPAPIIILPAVALLVFAFEMKFPNLQISTIGTRFSTTLYGVTYHGIPQLLPQFAWPWNIQGGDGNSLGLNFHAFQTLFSSAMAIAILAAIESLLSAVVADGMTQTRHDPDSELVALGTGNILCSMFGGIAATGAIARTATNIRFGAKSPISAMIHAGCVLLVLMLFAPMISYIPMASMAALLLFIAYNMSDTRHFFRIIGFGLKGDAAVLLVCFSLTVLFDMVIGVSVGVMLAAFMFMKRMAEMAHVEMLSPNDPKLAHHEKMPLGTLLYEIEGPLFFGAAQKAMSTINITNQSVKAVIFSMEKVTTMDVTGLVEFETAIQRLKKKGIISVLSGTRNETAEILRKSHILEQPQQFVIFCANQTEAVVVLKSRLEPTVVVVPTPAPIHH